MQTKTEKQEIIKKTKINAYNKNSLQQVILFDVQRVLLEQH